MKQLRVITLTVRIMGAPKQIKTFIYLGEIYNHVKKKLETMEMTGIDSIGPCKGPTYQTRKQLNCVLKPIDLNSYELTWATDGEIDLLIGGDNAGILVTDHETLNSIAKPANLRFYASPVFKCPLAF